MAINDGPSPSQCAYFHAMALKSEGRSPIFPYPIITRASKRAKKEK